MTLREWLADICETESPDSSIVAFNFGLFETEDGYTVYLTGSKEYNDEDPDWATNSDFEPVRKYYPLPSEEFRKLAWSDVLNKISLELADFTDTEIFRNSFFSDAKAITTGFDDGDVILIAKDGTRSVQ